MKVSSVEAEKLRSHSAYLNTDILNINIIGFS